MVVLLEVDVLCQVGQVKILVVMFEECLFEFLDVLMLKEYGLDWSVGGWVVICGLVDLLVDIQVFFDFIICVVVQDIEYLIVMKNSGVIMQFLMGVECKVFMVK